MKRQVPKVDAIGVRILVTGGAGYIGSHTAKALARAGFTPIVLDNLSVGQRHAVRWGPLHVGDTGDTDRVRAILVEERIEAVIHLAASAYVGESISHPQQYFHNNVANTLSLLEDMLAAGVHHFVFSSTCATYGVPRYVPIDEEHPQTPLSPYGESKLFVERALHWYGRAYDLGWVALRYFNAAGADPEGEIGEAHDPETHLIPLAIEAAAGRVAGLDIYGNDYETPDSTAIRDFIHVADLATAHVQALTYLLDGGTSCAVNLGAGLGHSVKEVVKMIETVSRSEVPVRFAARREGDSPVLVADARRAQSVLGWQPRHSDLRTIVEAAWRWQNQNAPPRSGYNSCSQRSATTSR